MDITTETQQGQDIISNISFNRFKTLVNAKSLKKLEPIFEVGNPNERTTSSSDPKVVRDDIIKVQFEAYATYTFKVIAETEASEFYNLVLYVNDQKEVVNSHLLKYIPSEKWLADPSQYFSGNVSIVNNTFFDENSFTDMLRGGDNCTETVNPVWVCEKGLAHYPGHPDCWQATWWKFYLEVETGSCGGAGSDSDNGNFDPLAGNPGNTGGPGGNGGNPNPGDPTGDPNNIETSPNVVGDIDFHIARAKAVALILNIQEGTLEYAYLTNFGNKNEVEEIADFINENTDAESKLFAKKAVEELLNNGDVDLENRLVYESSFEETETKCVHDKLINDSSNNFYKLMISAFTNNDFEMLSFSVATLPNGDWGITKGHVGNNNTSGFDYYNITINSEIESLSNLAQLVSLSHELIHAYMLNSLDNFGLINYDTNGNPGFIQHNCSSIQPNVNLNTLTTRDRWVALICAYNTANPGDDDWPHTLFNTSNFLVNSYKAELENLILNNHSWDEEPLFLKNELISHFGNQWKEKAAEFISWRGLEKTNEFVTWAQNNNIDPTLNSDGQMQDPFYNAIIGSIKNFGKRNCL